MLAHPIMVCPVDCRTMKSASAPHKAMMTPHGDGLMHTATPELHHPGAQTARVSDPNSVSPHPLVYPQACAGVKVVGSNHRPVGFVLYQQVLAKVIKQINVMPRDGSGQPIYFPVRRLRNAAFGPASPHQGDRPHRSWMPADAGFAIPMWLLDPEGRNEPLVAVSEQTQ